MTYTCPTHGPVEPVFSQVVTDPEVGLSNSWMPFSTPICPDCECEQELEVEDE